MYEIYMRKIKTLMNKIKELNNGDIFINRKSQFC